MRPNLFHHLHRPHWSELALAGAILVAPSGCAFPEPSPPSLFVKGVLLDPTDSRGKAPVEHHCLEVGERLRQAMQDRQRGDVHVALFTTGDRDTGYEPVVLAPFQQLNTRSKSLGGHSKERKHIEDRINAVVEQCKATITARRDSPIYRAVARIVDAVNARCLELGVDFARCRRTVYLHSDLKESVYGFLRTPPRKGATVQPLDTKDLKIVACGRSQTRGSRRSHVVDLERWRTALGDGAPTFFNPVCPAPHATEVTR